MNLKTITSTLLIILTAGAIWWATTRDSRQKREKEDLVARTSDAPPTRRTITIAGDDWIGYAPLRSNRFASLLAQKGLGVRFEEVPDTAERITGLQSGKYQFAAATLDRYLALGGGQNWPAVAVWTIDESHGGDAIISKTHVENINSLDNLVGAYTKNSPSEFLLKSQAANFRLNNLLGKVDSMGTDSIEEAYHQLASGKAEFAVLWEPFVSKALKEIKGTKVLMDTTQAKGIITDVMLASRTELATHPEDANLLAQAYFQTLHEWMASPATLTEAALEDMRVKDPQKTIPEAEKSIQGLRWATLQDNTDKNGWACQENPKISTSITQLKRILDSLGTKVNLPPEGPKALILTRLANSVIGVPPVAGARPQLGSYYKPLTPSEWKNLEKNVKGTLLETPILFIPGTTEIPEETREEILEATPKLEHYPSYRVIIEAHSYGNSPEDDQALSEERAAEIKRMITWECGIPEERVLAIGKGSTEQLSRGNDENERAFARRNRRARILLVGE